MSELVEFGLDEKEDVVSYTDIDNFKQEASEKRVRVSVISFKSWLETKTREKMREKGAALTTEEKLELADSIDKKLAEKLSKKVEDLTEVDRLNVQDVKFVSSKVHYRDGIGTIRCLSEYSGKKLISKEECCGQLGDPDQKIGCIIMKYMVDPKNLQVDIDDLIKQKVRFHAWVFSPKKFSKIDTVYGDARNESRFVCDIKSTLGEGDNKFQNQSFEHMNCAWMSEKVPPEVRYWVKEEGLKLMKGLDKTSLLGFQMSKPKLLEKLSGGSGDSSSVDDSASKPKLNSSYEDVI